MTYLTFGQHEYLVLENEEAVFKAVSEYCQETIWAFNPTFLQPHCEVNPDVIKSIQSHYEGGNDALINLIDDWDHFVNDAIGADGAGHFLASYDGEEIDLNALLDREDLDEEDWNDIIDFLESEGFKNVSLTTPVFRIN